MLSEMQIAETDNICERILPFKRSYHSIDPDAKPKCRHMPLNDGLSGMMPERVLDDWTTKVIMGKWYIL